MAEKNKHHDWQPEKIVIVAGPSFGSAIKFMLFGAALGATGAILWASQRGESSAASLSADSAAANPEARAVQLTQRLTDLSRRIRSLAGRARETAQHAGEVIGPAISHAVAEAKSASHEVQQEIEDDLRQSDLRQSDREKALD